jgi:hypothetical protein
MLGTIGVACGGGKAAAVGDAVKTSASPSASALAEQDGDGQVRARVENQNQKAQLESYRSKVSQQAQAMSQSIDKVQPLAANPEFGDIYWEAHLRDGLASWKATYKEADAMTPAAGYEEFHAKYVQALRSLNATGDHVLAGLQPPDANRIKSGAEEMNEGKQLLEQARALLAETQS